MSLSYRLKSLILKYYNLTRNYSHFKCLLCFWTLFKDRHCTLFDYINYCLFFLNLTHLILQPIISPLQLQPELRLPSLHLSVSMSPSVSEPHVHGWWWQCENKQVVFSQLFSLRLPFQSTPSKHAHLIARLALSPTDCEEGFFFLLYFFIMNAVNTNRMAICLFWGPLPSPTDCHPLSVSHFSNLRSIALTTAPALAVRLFAIVLLDFPSQYTLIKPLCSQNTTSFWAVKLLDKQEA